MGKFIDYTGVKIKKFTVIKRIEDYISPKGHPVAMWECVCECGNTFRTNSNSINGDKVSSCGCVQKETASKLGKLSSKNLIGEKFGRLTVVKSVDRPKDKTKEAVHWLCKCDCGKEIITYTYMLTSGRTRSCGCLRKEGHRKYNKYIFYENYGVGYTSMGYEFYFDLEDYYRIKDCYWYKVNGGYLNSYFINSDGRPDRLYMHREILNPPDNMYVDHINHNTNDNRKCNLRVATPSQNNKNKSLRKTNKSGITGISWDSNRFKWAVHININKKSKLLGRYDDIEDAIDIRLKAEEKYYGDYSYKNSIEYSKEYEIDKERAMNNKLVLINLSDKQDVKDFYNTILDIPNDINICDGNMSYNAKCVNAYDFISLSKYICIEIVADELGDTSQAYNLIKKFEVEY